MVSEVETVLDATSRDVSYTHQDFERITELLCEVSGIRMPGTNEALVYSRLAKRIRKLNLSTFADYVTLVGQDLDERTYMIEALTTNTTRFFREEYHFEILERELLNHLAENAKRGGRIRLWSAACSSGEEPYSMAAVILRSFPQAARYDFRILATDIDRSVLSFAQEGRFEKQKLGDLNAEIKKMLFESQDAQKYFY